MKFAPSRITTRILLYPLACAGLVSCSSSHKASYETASGKATSSSPAAPSSPALGFTAQAPESSASAGASMAAGGLPLAAATKGKHAHRRNAHATAAPLKREGSPCVPLASKSPLRSDFSSSPSTINPCGVGSMNLPTMAPADLAKPR